MANPTPGRTFILGLVMKRRYDKNGNISEEEKARIEGIDAALEPLDEPGWSYWPSLTEVIADGRHGTELELRSRYTGIDWCENILETEENYRIPPHVQEIIRNEYPLNKKYEVGLIKRHIPSSGRSPDNELFPLVHWLGDKDGDIPIIQKYKFTGGKIDGSLVPPPASLPTEDELYRHLLFPVTKYDWVRNLHEFCQQTSGGSGDLLRQVPDIGFYNDFLKPHVECSPRVGKPSQVMISIPIINIKPGQKFRDQKTAERYIRYQPAPLRAPGYEKFYRYTKPDGQLEIKRPIYLWTNALDDTMFVRNESGGPTVYSSRSLFEYRHPRKRTEHLDDRQSIRRNGVIGFSRYDNYICVDQMWAVVIPGTETLATFQQLVDPKKVLERAHLDTWDLEASRKLWIPPVGPVHEFLLFFGSLALKTHYAIIDSFRDAAADINFRVSSNPVGDESLIQDCNYLLAELSILIDITLSQLDVLAGVKNTLIDEDVIRPDEFVAASEFYTELTDRLNAVIRALREYQQDGQQVQNLLFQLLSTENAKQQARMSTQQAEIAEQTAKETAVQVRMAEKAEEQSKSVLVFTIITTVFLPLSFFTSYYGMDATSADISDASAFWRMSGPASVIIVFLAMSLAFRDKIKRTTARILHLRKRQEKMNAAPAEDDLEKGPAKPSKTPTFFFYPTAGQKID